MANIYKMICFQCRPVYFDAMERFAIIRPYNVDEAWFYYHRLLRSPLKCAFKPQLGAYFSGYSIMY